jgi:hypothetical protein
MIMEPITEIPHALSNPVIAVAVLLALNIVVKCGDILWKIKERKDAVTEHGIEALSKAVDNNTEASKQLATRLQMVEAQLSGFNKLKLDMRRLYIAVKRIAGDKWGDIRKEIMEEEVSQ